MSYSYLLRSIASLEFIDAFVWYEEQQDGLGEIFNAAVTHKLRQICNNPFHYKKSYRNFHEALTEKFPFLIVYLVDEKSQLIIVIAIFHTSRSPRGKFKPTRLK